MGNWAICNSRETSLASALEYWLVPMKELAELAELDVELLFAVLLVLLLELVELLLGSTETGEKIEDKALLIVLINDSRAGWDTVPTGPKG